jgi:hypothetical protein
LKGSGGSTLKCPVGDVGTLEGICAQCAASDEPLWNFQPPNGDPPIRVHNECFRFWLKASPQPKGRVLAMVRISEIEVEQPVESKKPWSTPTLEDITDSYIRSGPDDDIRDIDIGWRN